MAISMYDISVTSYTQTLAGLSGVLERGRAHCEAQGIDLAEVTQMRLAPDMLPFSYQVTATLHHMLATMAAMQSGRFAPPPPTNEDYAALQAHAADAQEKLRAYTPEQVNGWTDNDIAFVVADRNLPFRATDFVLSFSLPNVFFHATTVYAMLRMRGVPLGKRDYSGPMRIKR